MKKEFGTTRNGGNSKLLYIEKQQRNESSCI